MANTLALVKQAEVTRYVKAVVAAGIAIGLVRVATDGSVEIYPAGEAPTDLATNPWDRFSNGKK